MMEKKIYKIKTGIYKIALVSVVSFIVSFIVSIICLTILVINRSWFALGFAIFFGVISLLSLIILICGFAFLNANKNWKDISRVKKINLLDWGIAYFYYSSLIEKYSDNKEQNEIKI